MLCLGRLYIRQIALIAHMPELTGSGFNLAFLRRINKDRVSIAGKGIRRADAEFKFIRRERSLALLSGLTLLDEPWHERLFAIKKREHPRIASGAPIQRRNALACRTPLDVDRISRRVASEP